MADSETVSPSGTTTSTPASPPAPPAPVAIAPAMPLSDLLTLARAILRETGELPSQPGAPAPAAAQPPLPPAAAAVAGQPPLAPSHQARGPLPRDQKKFYKLGTAPAVAEPPAAGQPDGTVPANGERVENSGASAVEPQRLPELAKMTERTSGRHRSLARKRRFLLLKLSALFAVAALLLGLLFGWLLRPDHPATAVAAQTAAGGAEAKPIPNPAKENLALFTAPDEGYRRALRTLDEALAARQARDWPRAEALIEQAGRESPSLSGVSFRLAELALRRGDLIQADTLANRSLQAGEEVAESYALRAILAQRSGSPNRALEMLEAAGRANPYESRYLLYQSQVLRQNGKLQEAADRLTRALDRAEDPTQQSLIELNLRLTKIELGQDKEFADELTAQLAQPNPVSEWLLTAAARDLQAGRFTEAADSLRRAFQGRSPVYATARLSDVFFSRFADRPELAPLYARFLPKPAPPPLTSPAPTAVGLAPAAPASPASQTTPAPRAPLVPPGASPAAAKPR